MQAEVAKNRSAAEGPPLEDRWHHRAERFDRVARAAADATLPAALADQLHDSDVVIDIGAGTGRHAVLFAKRCRRVIAIEPSPAMRARLEQRVRDEGLTNVLIVNGRWPMERPPEGDVVFSSHVLYGVEDVASFLAAMTAAARRCCALYLGLRAPGSALDPLRRHLRGTPIPRRPAALEALNVLHQFGVPASLSVIAGSERHLEVGAEDEDLTDLCHRLSLEPSDANRSRLRGILKDFAPRREDGTHLLGATGPNALVGWPAR
ncbi:MAG: class I SAM-dependent methyltransferase [Polyangiaceae bacterium]